MTASKVFGGSGYISDDDNLILERGTASGLRLSAGDM